MTDTPETLAERLERIMARTNGEAIVLWRRDALAILAALRDAEAAQQRVAELEAALREIVAKAEADLTYEGEFIDYIVPFEGIDRASALLATGADR
jgi:hypothetical protein